LTYSDQGVLLTEKANLGKLKSALLIYCTLYTDSTASKLSQVTCALLRLLVSNFHIFGIFRLEAVIIVQRFEVPYWHPPYNFCPKMGYKFLFWGLYLLGSHDVPLCIKWLPPSLSFIYCQLQQ